MKNKKLILWMIIFATLLYGVFAIQTVTLISPLNDSVTNSEPVNFVFNITENSPNCSLMISTNYLNSFASDFIEYNITDGLSVGQHNLTYLFTDSYKKYGWKIDCYNSLGEYKVQSENRVFTVNTEPPLVTKQDYSFLRDGYNLSEILLIKESTDYRQEESVIFVVGRDSIINFSINNSCGYSYINNSINKSEPFTFGLDVNELNASYCSEELLNFEFQVCDTAENCINDNYTVAAPSVINIEFRDENYYNLINSENITLELINNDWVYNFSTSDGIINTSYIAPNRTYVLRYSAANNYGDERFYVLNATSESEDLTLFLLNETIKADLTVVTRDKTELTPFEGAIVYIQRYNISSNSFYTVDMCISDISGSCYFEVEQGTEYYKFLVDYPFGTRRLTTEKMYIEGSTLNLYVPLFEQVAETFFEAESITYSKTYSQPIFSVSYTDVSAVATEFCLYVKKYERYSKNVVDSTCSSSSSGTLESTHSLDNGTYFALFTAKIDGEEQTVTTFWADYNTNEINTGSFGVFMTVVIVIMFTFLSQLSVIAMILAAVGLIFAKFLSLITISWGYVIMILILTIVLTILIEVFKK